MTDDVSVIPQSLRDRAIAAAGQADRQYEEQQRERAEQDLQRARDRVLTMLTRFYGVMPDDPELRIDAHAHAFIDGLEFWAHSSDSHYHVTLYVMVPCGRCGEPVSIDIMSLAGLGRVLTEQQQHRPGDCPREIEESERQVADVLPPAPRPTIEQRIGNLLRELIGDEIDARRES